MLYKFSVRNEQYTIKLMDSGGLVGIMLMRDARSLRLDCRPEQSFIHLELNEIMWSNVVIG